MIICTLSMQYTFKINRIVTAWVMTSALLTNLPCTISDYIAHKVFHSVFLQNISEQT